MPWPGISATEAAGRLSGSAFCTCGFRQRGRCRAAGGGRRTGPGGGQLDTGRTHRRPLLLPGPPKPMIAFQGSWGVNEGIAGPRAATASGGQWEPRGSGSPGRPGVGESKGRPGKPGRGECIRGPGISEERPGSRGPVSSVLSPVGASRGGRPCGLGPLRLGEREGWGGP